MTSTVGLGVCLQYRFADNTTLLVRVSELLSDYRQTLNWMISKHGSVVEISEPKTYSSLSPEERRKARLEIEERIRLVGGARDAFHTAQREKVKSAAA